MGTAAGAVIVSPGRRRGGAAVRTAGPRLQPTTPSPSPTSLSKGHLVLVTVLGFCLGLAWPWLRAQPAVKTAFSSASVAMSSLLDAATPYVGAQGRAWLANLRK